jgi:hypothetical protein
MAFPPGTSPPTHRDKDCKHNGFGNPALPPSNGSPPTPSLPISMSGYILPSQLTTTVVKIAMPSTPQMTFSPGSSSRFSPSEDHSTTVSHFDSLISHWQALLLRTPRSSLSLPSTTSRQYLRSGVRIPAKHRCWSRRQSLKQIVSSRSFQGSLNRWLSSAFSAFLERRMPWVVPRVQFMSLHLVLVCQ